jgi:hypothetical protein
VCRFIRAGPEPGVGSFFAYSTVNVGVDNPVRTHSDGPGLTTMLPPSIVRRAAILVAFGAALLLHSSPALSPISFELQKISFRLENSETAARNAPETMAGGVAVFDYNGDGRPDIFFTNGALISPL